MENKTNNVELPKSVESFLDYLHTIKNKSENTIYGYKCDLGTFVKFLMVSKNKKEITNKLLKSLTLDDLYDYLSYTEKTLKNSAVTRARKVACLQSYFHYLYKKAKIINEDISEELESPKIPKKKPVTLNIQQSRHLLTSLDVNDKNYYRDYAILTLFLNTGVRLEELSNIELSDIKDNKISILGKGSKERYLYLNEDCLDAINMYLNERQYDDIPEEEKNHLFLSNMKQKICKSTIQKMVKKHLDKAGLNGYSTHKLRGSFCTNLYDKGVGIKQLMILMGHSSVTTTERYINYDEKSLQDSVKDIY